jgi:two-component system sensor histidine kinase/response regulator
VEVAAHGQEALDLLFARAADSYAVVLMDLEMPVMDGREAVRRLRADARFADLPVIVMTAHTLGQALQDVLAQGINGYIAKPFEPDDLLRLLSPFQRSSLPLPSVVEAPPETSQAELQQAVEQIFIKSLRDIGEIDSTVLLRRFSRRIPFLSRALQRFVEESQLFSGKIRESLQNGDRETAHRHAHSFKGLAGTFAMKALQAALLELEKALGEGLGDATDEMAAVESRLQPLLGKLAGLPNCQDNGVVPADPGEVARVVAQLRQLLSESDGEAEELWRSNKGRLVGIYSPLQLATIERAINQWNVDEALAALAMAPPQKERQ